MIDYGDILNGDAFNTIYHDTIFVKLINEFENHKFEMMEYLHIIKVEY